MIGEIPHPTTPAWEGPYIGGFSQSIISDWAQGPLNFYIKYVCGLRDPKPPHENLPWGDTVHKGLENRILGNEDWIDTSAAYFRQNYPTQPGVFLSTALEMVKLYPIEQFAEWNNPQTEYILDYPFTHPLLPRESRFRGKVDVTDFVRLCDHKCKGRIYPQETAIEISEDLQMNAYSKFLQTSHWQYDLIQCPIGAYRCPERRNGETSHNYAQRIFYQHTDYKYGFPIANHLYQWISCVPHYQTPLAIDFYWHTTIVPLMRQICNFWEYVTNDLFNPNDLSCWNHLFYKHPIRVFNPANTDKFKGDYHSLIVGQTDFSDLIPNNSFYSELEE